MINPKHIGALVSRHIAEVEAGRLRFFALATGQTDQRYVDAAAALRRGDPALPTAPALALRCRCRSLAASRSFRPVHAARARVLGRVNVALWTTCRRNSPFG